MTLSFKPCKAFRGCSIIPTFFAAATAETGSRTESKNTHWKRYLKEAKIENFHWHDLRHTFASRLVMKGINLYIDSKLLGHRSLDMTERYAHLAPDFLQNAIDVLAIPAAQVTQN